MNERPVRLVVADDLRRRRLTVLFRLLLGVPHFFWWWIWTYAVPFTAIAQWLITVVRGRPSRSLSSFHAHYIRYTAHLTAYMTIVAERYPGFLGHPGYPVDVELDLAERQHRLSAAFRLLLALPALFFAASIAGWLFIYGSALLSFVAFLGWFASLVRGSMPRGLRNLGAYGIRFVAEATAYALLVTRTYPTTDPTLPAGAGGPAFHPIWLEVRDDRQRSRLTTFFRGLLTVPHFVWLMLWTVLVVFAAVANWLVTLVRGTPTDPLHRFLGAWVRYQLHVGAYLWLIANPFPGFTGARGYPIELQIDDPTRQSRWATGFRFLLAIPAFVITNALQWLLIAAGIGGWFASLLLGRMPEGLRNIGAHALRYNAQVNAYAVLLTDRYPFSGPPALEPEPTADAAPA